MGQRIRVLHIVHNLNYGGLERVIADLVPRMDRERFECHVLCLEYLGRFADGLGRFAELHTARPMRPYSMLWPGPLIAQIRRIAPDVAHTHSGAWYKATLASRYAGVPRIVHTDHGRPQPDPAVDRLLDRLAARRTDIVVAVSDPLARWLAARVVGDARRIQVVPNGIDTDFYRPRAGSGAVRRELRLSASVPVIGSIGRLVPIKGYDVMVNAFARLRELWHDGPAPVLVLAGDGDERSALERQAERLGIRDAVRMMGWRDDIHDLHDAFTLFTLASRSEGTSISLLAAMSAGICPVVTDVGGNASILGDALRHRLVAAEDPDALARAWLDALSDRARRTADAAAGRERVQQAFALRTTVRRYEQIYSTPPVVRAASVR